MDLEIYLREKKELVDSYLRSYFSIPSAPPILHEAMKYSLFAGGKRIRPVLALASYEACGGNSEHIVPQAAALELIHTYSLIHDDLPAMDNDDLRRGKPTNHKVFGEAMAILAGDALLTESFVMMTEKRISDVRLNKQVNDVSYVMNRGSSFKTDLPISHYVILKIVREVAMAAGAKGMVGGQAQDILSENTEPDTDTVEFIHLHKTAALITAAVRIGGILARCGRKKLNALTKYGENIGLAFQIVDDILDIEATTEELGKPIGSDRKKKKLTYPSLFGEEAAKQRAKDHVAEALRSLRIFSTEADPLREIAKYLVVRRN